MDDPSKILIIQLKRAGDVLLTTPIPEVLRRCFPQAQIHFLVKKPFAPLLEHHPAIDHVHVYDPYQVVGTWRNIRQARYDWVLDFQSSPRSALVCLTSGARQTAGYRVPFWGLFYTTTVSRPQGSQPVIRGKLSLVEALIGPVTTAPERTLVLTAEERQWAACILPSPSKEEIVGLIPTHRRASRRWTPESFVQLARRLVQEGQRVWWFWGPGERDDVQALQKQVPETLMIPETSLRQMASLLQRCRVVVTNDNGPMHLAVAVGTPTVTIYGPTDPVCWNPGVPPHQILQARDVPCLGCNLNACPFEHECMTHVSAEQVYAACRWYLKVPSPV